MSLRQGPTLIADRATLRNPVSAVNAKGRFSLHRRTFKREDLSFEETVDPFFSIPVFRRINVVHQRLEPLDRKRRCVSRVVLPRCAQGTNLHVWGIFGVLPYRVLQILRLR